MCDMCTVIGQAVAETAEQAAPTLRLAASQTGTVQTLTERGLGKSLLLRLVGPTHGFGPLASVEIVIDPDLIHEFLTHLHAEAHELFPEDVPAPVTPAPTGHPEQKEAPTPR